MGDRGARDEGAPGSHELSRDCSVAQLNFCQQRVVLCEDSHYDGEPCVYDFLLLMAHPINCSNWMSICDLPAMSSVCYY